MPTHAVRYAEDYQIGEIFNLGEQIITEQEIVSFASQWDPQPFHLDKQFATASVFGGLIASGWHVSLIMMRMMIHGGFISPETGLGSPGADGLKWLKPVRPNDRLNGKIEVVEVRISKSKPELGFVTTVATLRNQHDEDVYWLKSASIVRTLAAKRG